MTKPVITKRTTKGSALTYSELDANFQNLQDATISLTAGSGGTQVTADLNGNITLVAGTNITLTGDNTAKTITINSTGGGGGSNTFTDIVTIQSSGDNTNSIIFNPDDTNYAGDVASIKTGSGIDGLVITTNSQTSRIYIQDDGSFISFQVDNYKPVIFLQGLTKHEPITTTARNNITAVNGMIIYNSTDNKFQGYAGGSWVDLH